jgi:predicted Zn-dependent peptidase
VIEKKVLQNKATLLYQKSPGALSVSVGLWVRVGSRHETNSERGYTHFLEHMVFKGTSSRTARQIASEIERVGGFMNAATSREYTYFYITVMKSEIELAIDLLCDMVCKPLLSEEDIKNERKVVLEEMKGYEDDPEEFLHDFYYKNFMPKSSLGYDIIGNKKSISNASMEKIRNYYNKYYIPSNFILSISGDFESSFVFDLSKKYLSGFERQGESPDSNEKPEKKYDKFLEKRNLEQVSFIIGSDGISKDIHESVKVSLFNIIFGSTMSSRLFQTIREDKGLCYSINSYSSSYSDSGIFSIGCSTSKKNFEVACNEIFKEINKVFKEGITELELKDAKSNQKGSMSISYEHPDNKMTDIAIQEIYYSQYFTIEDRVKLVDKVSVDEIQQLIEFLFNREKFHLSAIGNLKEKVFNSIQTSL